MTRGSRAHTVREPSGRASPKGLLVLLPAHRFITDRIAAAGCTCLQVIYHRFFLLDESDRTWPLRHGAPDHVDWPTPSPQPSLPSLSQRSSCIASSYQTIDPSPFQFRGISCSSVKKSFVSPGPFTTSKWPLRYYDAPEHAAGQSSIGESSLELVIERELFLLSLAESFMILTLTGWGSLRKLRQSIVPISDDSAGPGGLPCGNDIGNQSARSPAGASAAVRVRHWRTLRTAEPADSGSLSESSLQRSPPKSRHYRKLWSGQARGTIGKLRRGRIECFCLQVFQHLLP